MLDRALERYSGLPDEKKIAVCSQFLPNEDATEPDTVDKLATLVQAVAMLEEFALRVDYHWISSRLDTILASDE